MFCSVVRTRAGAALALIGVIAGTGAGAATLRRYAVTSATGSGGATTFIQSDTSGSALQGEVASSANTGIKIPFGVLGEYNATGSKFGSGVLGIATTGYGIGAESLSATQPSLIALNSSGGPGAQMFGEKGGDALDLAGIGGGYGLSVTSDSKSAINASAQASGYAAVYSEDDSTAAGFGTVGSSYSSSSGGIGVLGGSYEGGIGVMGMADSASQGLPAVQAYTETDGTELFDAGVSDSNTDANFSVSTVLSSVSNNASQNVYLTGRASSDLQINGDVYLTGGVYTHCNSNVPYSTDGTTDCSTETLSQVRSSTGPDYEMYASAQASKTVEDAGEAELRGGIAHVTLDPSFASVISKREPYLVFTTPQGDTHGL